MPPSRLRFRFTTAQRLTHAREFAAVFGARMFRPMGIITVHARPNDRDGSRLGLSVSRRVGNAVRRTRIKRLIRDAFRLLQHELPPGYDFVVSVQPHEPQAAEAYRDALLKAAQWLDQTWTKRLKHRSEQQRLPDSSS